MKNELLAANLAEFRENFATFHDAVIHYIHYDIFSQTEPRIMQVALGTRYRTTPQEKTWTSWTNLTFEIESVTKVILKKPKNYGLGIVFRLGIGFFDSEVHLNFINVFNPDDPTEYDERPEDKLAFIVTGKRCFWWLSPYKERGDSAIS